MITASGAKIYSDIANSPEELKMNFNQWLNDMQVGTSVVNAAKAGAYNYTFGIPNRFLSIAEDYLKELGYKVVIFPELINDSCEVSIRYITIDWRD